MKERPILFSAPMVRALLDGSKTQTRRIVKPQPIEDRQFVGGAYIPQPKRTYIKHQRSADVSVKADYVHICCPYGQPGDRLWVREAFDFLPAGGADEPQACEIVYWATGRSEPRIAPSDYNPMIYGHEKVRPSFHMPRWASRITLEITGVRVERLQDISEADAIAEGIEGCDVVINGRSQGKTWRDYSLKCDDPCEWFGSPIRSYRTLWESINGAGSWDANPWVWAVEFKEVTE